MDDELDEDGDAVVGVVVSALDSDFDGLFSVAELDSSEPPLVLGLEE